MTGTGNSNFNIWQWWFTPRSTDPTVTYRERALRVLLPTFLFLRLFASIGKHFVNSDFPEPYAPEWLSVLFFVVPMLFSFYFMLMQKVDWAGTFFVLHWFLVDLLSLPSEGYWYAGIQISLIIQVVLAALLLPGWGMLPFLVIQLATFGIWGYWLDFNYYDPPLLSSGQPVAVFWRTIITLGAQEAIILFIVRYLRLEMEKSLRLQQSTIGQLQGEIEERKKLQEIREKLILELEQKNAELERFTYTISHELKTPLVTIKNYVGSIGRDLQNGNYERAREDISRVLNGTDKMQETIRDLLELSRIGRIISPSEEIDSNQLIQDALTRADALIRSKNISLKVASNLPNIRGDRIRLREVLENLISNAAKYMGGITYPLIEIGAREQETEVIIYVKDNGIGIDPRYHTRIFNLFEKLDPSIDGTGIGLALVKRIVEYHGGRVWVESNGLGEGSTFYFTLPNDGEKDAAAITQRAA